MKTIKNFAKRILMYVILLIGIFIACTFDSISLFYVLCAFAGMIFVWKTFNLGKTFAEEFKSDLK
jgi:hypothetical protein